MNLTQLQIGIYLSTQLTVKNLDGEGSFDYTVGLHTYFKVKDIHTTLVNQLVLSGQEQLHFLDNMQKRQAFVTNDRAPVSFSGEFDRIFLDTSNNIQILQEGGGESPVVVEKSFKDAVIWNPWAEKAKSIPDLGDDEWKEFVCVEAVQFQPAVVLQKGQEWKAGQFIYLSKE